MLGIVGAFFIGVFEVIELQTMLDELGIASTETDSVAFLIRSISRVTARIRNRTGRFFCGVCDSITDSGGLYLVRSYAHRLSTGDSVVVSGSETNPSIDGTWVVTVVSADTFTLDGSSYTGDASKAYIHPVLSQEFPIKTTGAVLHVPQACVPCNEILLVEIRTSMTQSETITTDEYEVVGDYHRDRGIALERLTAPWCAELERTGGARGLIRRQQINSARVTVALGAPYLDPEIEWAVVSMVSDEYERQGEGRDQSSMSFEGESTQRMRGEERRENLQSIQNAIESWKVKY